MSLNLKVVATFTAGIFLGGVYETFTSPKGYHFFSTPPQNTEIIQKTNNLNSLILHKINEEFKDSILKLSDATKQKSLQIMKFGLPSHENLRIYSSYISSANYVNKIPNWVQECLTLNDRKMGKLADRKYSSWQSDSEIPLKFKGHIRDIDVWSTGLNRGHLAAAGAHHHNQREMDDTFIIGSNIVPQEMSFNGSDWLKLERFTTGLLELEEEKYSLIYVICGPIFEPINDCIEYNLVGRSKMSVPTHLFKILLAKNTTDKTFEISAFIMKNKAVNDNCPLPYYQVNTNEIENLTGLNFFPYLEDLLQNDKELKDYKLIEMNIEKLFKIVKIKNPERIENGKCIGNMKCSQNFTELEQCFMELNVLHNNYKDDPKWLQNMHTNEYKRRKKQLIELYQEKLNSFRKFTI